MSDASTPVSPAGWYVDPATRRHLRWWNGQAWTESVAPLPGEAPTAYIAPAPRVRQTFALGGIDDDTHAAAEQTRAARRRFDEQQTADAAPQPFVTQVPVEVARPATPEPRPVMNTQPTTPWPAPKPAVTKPTIDWDAVASSPATSSFTSNEASRLGDFALGGDPATGLEGPGVTNPDVTPEMIAEARARIEASRAAARAAVTPVAEPALDTEQTPIAEPAPFAEQAPFAEPAPFAESGEAPRAETHPSTSSESVASSGSAANAPAFMSRREARMAEAAAAAGQAAPPAPVVAPLVPTITWESASPVAATAPEPVNHTPEPAYRIPERANTVPEPVGAEERDPWAGEQERHSAPIATAASWTGSSPTSRPISGSRPAVPLPPSRSGTASAWLLALTPLFLVVGGYLVLDLLTAYWQIALIAVFVIVWLFGLLFAQQDRAKLIAFGHMRPPSVAWALLTAPVYLVLRAVSAQKAGARAVGPLIGWAVCFVLVAALLLVAVASPGLLPAYLVDTLDPLRDAIMATAA